MKYVTDDRGYSQIFDLTHKSNELRLRHRADMMIAEISKPANKKLMEIGAGTGDIAYWIAEQTPIDVLATDLCIPFVDIARNKYVLPNLRYEVLDFNKAEQFNNEKFDYIIGNGILHHLYHNLDTAFENMLDLLNKDGKIVFMEPNLFNPYVYLIFSYGWIRELVKLEPDEMAFSPKYITKKMERAGYKDIKVTFRDFVLPGLPQAIVKPVIAISDVLEKVPMIRCVSQSIFITAVKK